MRIYKGSITTYERSIIVYKGFSITASQRLITTREDLDKERRIAGSESLTGDAKLL
ncbi:MAG: hypothetical protein LBK00_08145 [Treponema sp.]|nr:hypothetical protein [Treponema sp.]